MTEFLELKDFFLQVFRTKRLFFDKYSELKDLPLLGTQAQKPPGA